MYRWSSVWQGFCDRWSILSIKKKKSLTGGSILSRWSAWPIVSIDSIGIDLSIHRWLCPSMILGLILVVSVLSVNPGYSLLCLSLLSLLLISSQHNFPFWAFMLIFYVDSAVLFSHYLCSVLIFCFIPALLCAYFSLFCSLLNYLGCFQKCLFRISRNKGFYTEFTLFRTILRIFFTK